MAQQKKMVENITSMEEDFSQWYTDVVKKAELMDYSSVKGCMVIEPYGYALWENMQADLDRRFKKLGVQNVYMPMFIPESLLQKEKDHVEGFAPECAVVTEGGGEKLPERLFVRPTSETLFCEHYQKIIHSYRDLPKLYNQWCSVVRWEKTTRPFLRSSEFLWQEGHTMHETAQEAQEFTLSILKVYEDFYRETLAIPAVVGQKTEKEKFAGAEATYTIEPMMHNGVALQGGTSHYFGDGFAKAFDITYTDRENKLPASPSDLLGRFHPDDWRCDYGPRRRQRPGAAPEDCPHPGGDCAGGHAQARRAGKGPGAAGAALRKVPGEAGRQRQLPRLEVRPV